ncbi:hypothetical protein BGZ82_007863 [Podila clonocystis]|nr:hypothetical protein BGZ82_007863 [Podila clonocystis]
MAPAPADMDNGQPPPHNNGQLSPADNGNENRNPPQLRDLNDVLRQQIERTSLRRRTQLLEAMGTIVQAYSVGRDDDVSFIVEQYISIREHNIKLQLRIDEYEKKERNSTGASASSSNVTGILDDEEATSSTTIVSSSASAHTGAPIDKSEMLIHHLRSELYKANMQATSATIDLKSLQAERFLLATRLDLAEKATSALQSKHEALQNKHEALQSKYVEERTNFRDRTSTLQQELINMKLATLLQGKTASKIVKDLEAEKEALKKELEKASLIIADQVTSNPTTPTTPANPTFASSSVASASPIATPVSGSNIGIGISNSKLQTPVSLYKLKSALNSRSWLTSLRYSSSFCINSNSKL